MKQTIVTAYMEIVLELEALGLTGSIRVLATDEENSLIRLYKRRVPRYFPFVGGTLIASDETDDSQHAYPR